MGIRMMRKRMLGALCLLLLFAGSTQAVIRISVVGDGMGYDMLGTGAGDHESTAFRSTGVTKVFDVDGDDAYGTAGLFMFGDGGAEANNQPFTLHTQVDAAWATFSAGSNFSSIAQGYGQGPQDDPTAVIRADVEDWGSSGSAVTTGGGSIGSMREMLTFSYNASTPQQFRIGLVGGMQGQSDGRWDPTSYMLSDGTTFATVAGLENNANGAPNMVFFDVDLNGEISGTFHISGAQRLATQGASLGGVTFDVPLDGVFPSAPVINYFVVAHTETEGVAKAAWSVSNAVSVSLFDAADEAVAGVSGLQGIVDIPYTSGDTFTLVAESNGVERTSTKTIITTVTQEDQVTFSFTDSPLTNSTDPTALTRRDPSDVIQVGDTWHVWYSKAAEGVTSGYDASVWHATSTNQGNSWIEQREAVPRGTGEDWDVTSTFTPNILFHDGTYYLYYTGVGPNFTQDYAEEGKTRIGVATSSSVYGPWTKYAGNPILVPSSDTTKFDSFRIDDTCMAVRGDQVWLYYKGRPWGLSSANTKMGVAVATNGVGPFVRQNGGDPVQLGGHEVQIWMDEYEGIYSLVNGVGPAELTYTIQYAPDGLNFTKYADTSTSGPHAPGLFRRELVDPSQGGMPEWGIEGTRQLGRYEMHIASTDLHSLRIYLNPASITEGNRMGDWIGGLDVASGSNYVFALLPILNDTSFLIESTSVTANAVFDTSVTNQVGLFIRASGDDVSSDAYFDVDVLEAGGMRGWRLEAFGADVLAQTNLEATVWGDDANPDGDAFSNVDEYIADTLPLDAHSALRVVSFDVAGPIMELSWVGGEQATQYIETCSALSSNAAWFSMATNLPPTAVSNVLNLPVSTAPEAALFRIKTVR